MNCPKCREEAMQAETFEGVEIERCPVCKGIFFDKGELEALAKAEAGTGDTFAFSPISDAMDTVKAHCARCDRDMKAEVDDSSGVRIDSCDQCGGAFLDQGELATLQLTRGSGGDLELG
ncbi:MAG: zf-TFIIB domain-containing protein [Myxococcales bacterium]|nr:zf-TFIIB domain-containing protein [Myxococcales bacterium]